MTRAFRLNLEALSLLALLVGSFLIYNTMTFSVVQRRPLIGRLRTLGVTRREIFRRVLGEAALLATIGSVLGGALACCSPAACCASSPALSTTSTSCSRWRG